MLKAAVLLLLCVVLAIEIYSPVVYFNGFCQLWRAGYIERVWLTMCASIYLGIVIGTVLAFIAELWHIEEDNNV